MNVVTVALSDSLVRDHPACNENHFRGNPKKSALHSPILATLPNMEKHGPAALYCI